MSESKIGRKRKRVVKEDFWSSERNGVETKERSCIGGQGRGEHERTGYGL